MMSLAGSEMAGSEGKWTGLETILGWLAEVVVKKRGSGLFIYFYRILVPERWVSCQKFINQDS